ncbi:MAG: DUF1127 domain-containing protein [Pseudolabrys sp.]
MTEHARADPPFKIVRPFVALFARLLLWHRRARTRRHLRDLDSHLLRDVGLDAATRDDETAKWPWQGDPAAAKENGRCLRAPAHSTALVERAQTLRRNRTTTSTRAIS